MKLEEFLTKNRIPQDFWQSSELSWDELLKIAADHEANKPHLLQTAEFFAKIIQGFNFVHSVRWRVKDTEHLLGKIIRKKSEGTEKYHEINADNYGSIVTDLVGIRALHLFKEDSFEIDNSLRATWDPIEQPVAYVRTGDPDSLSDGFSKRDIQVKKHPAGYRSVHYVFASQPTQRKIIAEIQVRTIFEEGWSEIDHRVRYPNFSENQLVGYFLTIFNRLAGSADEMGDFVKGLASTLTELEEKLRQATNEKDSTLETMERALSELESAKEQNETSKQNIADLKREVEKFRRTNASESLSALSTMIVNGPPHLGGQLLGLQQQSLPGTYAVTVPGEVTREAGGKVSKNKGKELGKQNP